MEEKEEGEVREEEEPQERAAVAVGEAVRGEVAGAAVREVFLQGWSEPGASSRGRRT